MVYCPYTNREIPESGTSREHIIPLSLGGVNGFEVAVDTTFNSKVGADIDGALANEFLIAMRRTEYDARGHSGKEPMATVRATYGEDARPAQVTFNKKKGMGLWDARDREAKKVPGEFHMSASLNIDLPIRFTAKGALAAGYYVYGNLFREHVDHHQLREVMHIDPATLDLDKGPAALGLEHLTLRGDTYLHEVPPEGDLLILCLRTFCSTVRGSVVVLMPGKDCFGVAVGILGQYLAMVNVPANADSFQNEGIFAWGHVVSVVNKKLNRCSLIDSLMRTPECLPMLLELITERNGHAGHQ